MGHAFEPFRRKGHAVAGAGNTWPMTEWIRQIDYLKEEYGEVGGKFRRKEIFVPKMMIAGPRKYNFLRHRQH